MPATAKLIPRLSTIRNTIDLESTRSRRDTTNQAPNSPKTAPDAPSPRAEAGATREKAPRPAERAEQVYGEDPNPPQQAFQRRADQYQRPHVEDDVQRAEPAEALLVQERRGEQPVLLVVGHPDDR